MSVIYNPSAGNVYFDVAGSAITATTQPKKNSGAVGSCKTTSITDTTVVGVDPGNAMTGPVGPFQTSGTSAVVTGVVSGGTFSYMAEGDFVIRGESTLLNGSANTSLRFPGAGNAEFGRQPINYITGVRTTRTASAIVNGYWSEVSGTFTTTPTASHDNFGSDDVAFPSESEPGELSYYIGSGVTDTEYSAKGLW